jgi:hypothetical protein
MKLAFAIILLTATPAIAGVINSRDASGNLSRDKGSSASTIQQHAMVNSAVQSVQSARRRNSR